MGFVGMSAIAKLLGKKASGNSDKYLNEEGLATLISLLRQPVERKFYSWCEINEFTGNKAQYNTTSWSEGYTLKSTLGVNDIIMTGFINHANTWNGYQNIVYCRVTDVLDSVTVRTIACSNSSSVSGVGRVTVMRRFPEYDIDLENPPF